MSVTSAPCSRVADCERGFPHAAGRECVSNRMGAVNLGASADGGAGCGDGSLGAVGGGDAVESIGGWPGGRLGGGAWCRSARGTCAAGERRRHAAGEAAAEIDDRHRVVAGFRLRACLSATCSASIGGNCNWPRQRLTLLSMSSGVPGQGAALTVISSGLPSVGITIVANRIALPAASFQPAGSFHLGLPSSADANGGEEIVEFFLVFVDRRDRPDDFEEPGLAAGRQDRGQHAVGRFARRSAPARRRSAARLRSSVPSAPCTSESVPARRSRRDHQQRARPRSRAGSA